MGVMTAIGQLIDKEDQCARRFGAMQDRLDVDRAAFASSGYGASLRGAVARCRNCGDVAACETYLADPADRSRPEFCPNVDLFGHFRRD